LLRQTLTDTLLRRLDGIAASSSWRRLLPVGVRAANALSTSKTFRPIVWLDTCQPIEEFVPEQVGRVVGPNIGGRFVTDHVVLPPVRLYELTDVTIYTNFSAFVSDKGFIVERVVGVDSDRCQFVLGHPFIDEGRNLVAITEAPATRIEAGFFLSGSGYTNYFHWMIELLPKLRYWQTLSPELRALPLLIGEAASNPSWLEALALFCEEAAVQRLHDTIPYTVGRLLHMNAPNTCVFNLRPGQAEIVTDTAIRPEIIYDWRRRVGLGPGRHAGGHRRLFLARNAERRAYNQAEVLELFTSEGFEELRLEHMTLQEQIEAFSSADLIAGPEGAGWTNLIFCTPGSKALSWIADEKRDQAIYSTIAGIVGVDLRYITYRTGARSSEELYTAEYELELPVVERALARLLGEC
jgi:capsular polysaccharide biosynthesis protein